MNKLIYIALFVFLLGCEEQTTPVDDFKYKSISQSETEEYVDLYFYNYDSLRNDPVSINDVVIEGDKLIISLSYSGGCAEHEFNLARIHPSCGTPPLPPPTFQLKHNANGDACEAWITDTLAFNISRLQASEESPVTISFSANEYYDEYFQTNLDYSYE
ncbi:hypothetical protein [Sunxiuqinia indica]|uniref:hypothetical protein n=1 Tax=Sunxiuqinia indica TaxID=2692584 RepID=UPI00135B5AEA|nr:NigD-like C-terminal domain-containing protein [Sunxiuqinia indica]